VTGQKVNRQVLAAAAACALALGLPGTRPGLGAEPAPQQNCNNLAQLRTERFRVDTAEWVRSSAQLPEHCLFRVTLDPRPSGIEDLSYGTGIELRLPLDWNGRLLFQGGGGLNGVLGNATGNVPDQPSALQRGFAVVATDSGHRGRSGIDARFAVDQQARLDFAYQALERTTREARTLLNRYYGRLPDYTYFMGCSTGGREAMQVAQRLPTLFDGVVAGNAAFNFTRLVANQTFSLQTITRIAPRNADGKPDLSRAFTDAQLKGVSDAVLQRCDALDGLADGMINDFRACRFDPEVQVCDATKDARGAACLTRTQAEALRTVFGGAKNSRGESLYGSQPFDTGIAQPAWRSMHLGANGNPPANASLGRDTLTMYAMTPPAPGFDTLQFDWDKDWPRLAEIAAINDAVATLHNTFADRGGKLIIYHGLSDQAMFAGPLIDWYERIMPRDANGPQSWARLFMVPGMLHCAGGQATDRFDMLSAIQAWVEKGQAPDRVVASGRAFPGRTRPLCPYPQVARYVGGNPEDAASFACR
jgi:feruloyl esterase